MNRLEGSGASTPADASGRDERVVRTRRGFVAALITALGSALLVGLLWLFARRAPSAQRDPHLTPPAIP